MGGEDLPIYGIKMIFGQEREVLLFLREEEVQLVLCFLSAKVSLIVLV